jgi:hypothetical protein
MKCVYCVQHASLLLVFLLRALFLVPCPVRQAPPPLSPTCPFPHSQLEQAGSINKQQMAIPLTFPTDYKMGDLGACPLVLFPIHLIPPNQIQS